MEKAWVATSSEIAAQFLTPVCTVCSVHDAPVSADAQMEKTFGAMILEPSPEETMGFALNDGPVSACLIHVAPASVDVYTKPVLPSELSRYITAAIFVPDESSVTPPQNAVPGDSPPNDARLVVDHDAPPSVETWMASSKGTVCTALQQLESLARAMIEASEDMSTAFHFFSIPTSSVLDVHVSEPSERTVASTAEASLDPVSYGLARAHGNAEQAGRGARRTHRRHREHFLLDPLEETVLNESHNHL
jgi:hypothetical protein